MNNITAKAIIGVAGCVAVGVATYVTKSAYCLWGLLLVVGMIEQVD